MAVDIKSRTVHADPCPAFLLPFVQKGGKCLENGKVSYTGSIRHREPALCPHGSLGQHLVMRFTVSAEPFPDARDFDVWVTTPLWPGNNRKENLSYPVQAEAIKKYLQQELGIYVRKVTHIFRVLAARNLDEVGIDDKVGMRHCELDFTVLADFHCSSI